MTRHLTRSRRPWRVRHVGHARHATASPAGTDWRVTHAPRAATSPQDDHTHPQMPAVKPRGAQARPWGPRHPPRRSSGGWVFNGGHLERGVAGSSRIDPRERTCITRQSSAFASAVPCHACHTCVVRHGLARSAPLSSYACPARRDPSPGRPHPLQVPPLSPRSRDPPRDDRTHLQVPAVTLRSPRRRPGGNRHPTSGARRYPPGVQTRTEDRDQRRPARMPGGTGIAATARSASLPRLTGLPQFHPEDVERSEAQIKRRRARRRPRDPQRRGPAPASATPPRAPARTRSTAGPAPPGSRGAGRRTR